MKTYWRTILLLLVIFLIKACAVKNNNFSIEHISTNKIFDEGRFDACHSSTIEEIDSGKFISAWFAGSHEGANDVSIWISIYKSEKWSEPVKLVDGYDSLGNKMACWNPVLFKSKQDKLFLFYKVGKNPREWWGEVIISNDFGNTWEEKMKLPNGMLGPIKNKPVQLENGNIICPSSIETNGGDWSSHIEITDKDLSSWKKINIEKDSVLGVIQPTILTHEDNKLQILCRSNQNLIYESWSSDNGVSWSKLQPIDVPNPNSGIDAVSLQDGKFMLVYNPLLAGKDWWEGRNKLNLAISSEGKVWEDIFQLENERKGEFSYPAIIKASNGEIHITYTYDRKYIKHVIIE